MSDITRRRFLATAAAGAAMAEIAAIKATLAAQIGAVEGAGTALPGPDAYLLDPAITYLNHGSVGTIPRAVHEAHAAYLRLCESNPWFYMWSGAWEEPRARVRAKAGRYLGVPEDSLAITHNTTEGFNLLAHGLPLGPGDEVLFSTLNHDGASVPFLQQSGLRGFNVRRFHFSIDALSELTEDAILAAYDAAIRPATRLLVLPHIDNMVGVTHPVAAIARLAKARGVHWVAVDGAQAMGMIELDIGALGVDAYAMSGHKWLQAPKGTGLLYLSAEMQSVLRPMWTTWGQQRWTGTVRRYEDYGTRNFPALLAIEDALDFQAAVGAAARRQKLDTLREYALARVDAEPALAWVSPRNATLNDSLFAVSYAKEGAADSASRLFERYGIVVRPFGDPPPRLRLSPNVITAEADLDRFFDSLLLG